MPRSTHIGPYRILRLINQGGQGTVYLGFDSRLHRRVAIKIYRLPKDKLARRALLREAQLVASIQSPKVVQIYDLIVADDHIALIMEYVPGCDLEEFLFRVRPSLATIVAVCNDIAGALAVARQQHIVHGDLKASNVLVTEQGRVKLTDFGIARGDGGAASVHATAASLSCMSPEQYLGKPLDVRSDLFALGCLLYRMLTGKQAFNHTGEFDDEGQLSWSPPTIEGLIPESFLVPVALSDLLATLLQKSPENRPANTHQVRNTLREISRDIPLCVGNTLLLEAQGLFRAESPEDIPPLIPSDLTRNGRSGMKRSHAQLWRDFFAGKWALPAVLAVLFTFGLLGSVLVQAFFTEKPHIKIAVPSFHMAMAAQLPEELSSRWLVGEIEQAVGAYFADAYVRGGLAQERDKTFYSNELPNRPGDDAEAVPLVISSDLHCDGRLCLLIVVIEKEGRRLIGREAIFSNMPIAQWHDVVQSSTLALLNQLK